MKWTSRDALHVRKDMQSQANNYKETALLIPVETDTGNFDPLSRAGVDIQNTVSHATGKQITSWKVVRIKARITGQPFSTLMQVAMGANYDRTIKQLFFDKRHQDSMNQVFTNEMAYIYIDGVTYRPVGGIENAGIYRTDELYIEISSRTPRARATGY